MEDRKPKIIIAADGQGIKSGAAEWVSYGAEEESIPYEIRQIDMEGEKEKVAEQLMNSSSGGIVILLCQGGADLYYDKLGSQNPLFSFSGAGVAGRELFRLMGEHGARLFKAEPFGE